MSPTAAFRSIMPTVVVTLAVSMGCASQRLEPIASSNLQLHDAIEERDAAAAEVVKAIGRYCSLQTHTVESRERCVIGKEVEMAFIAAVESGHRLDLPEMTSGELLVQCAGEGRSTVCRRRPPAYAELWDRE
ncbi:hypothetical protein [Nitrospira sp. Nam74]